MVAVPTPAEETERLHVLRSFGVLDTPPEPAFDELAALAAQICATAVALIAFTDHNRQWYKARHGLTPAEAASAAVFCVCLSHPPSDLLIVSDAARDPRFAGHPLVTGESGIRFYAGVPLRTVDGHILGVLCVLDRQPRTLDSGQKEALRVLGRQVMAQLELRRSLHETLLNSARLQNSQRIAGLGDWEYDFVDQRLVWSDGVYRILGLTRRDAPPHSETFYRQVHPDDLAFVHREKKAAAAGARRVDFEHRIVRPGGEIRYIHQITETKLDDHGQPMRESGTVQDITDRKRAEDALRESEERYRLMFERNPSPMWIFDPVTLAFLGVNDAALTLYGFSRDEWSRMTVRDIRPTETVPVVADRVGSAPPQFRSTGHFQHRKKDGTVFPVDIYAHLIDFAGRPARLVLAVDRTESERAVDALRASEVRFRALSESAPLGIFECDPAGRVIYYNPALATLSGRPAADSIGQGWAESIHPDDRAAMSAGWERAAAAGAAWDQEQRLLRPDGSIRWVHTLAAPTRGADGVITGYVGTVEDITERRAAGVATLESEERYRKMLMLSPDAHFVHVNGLITLVNQRFCQLMGATEPAQLLGRPALEVTHADFQDLVRERREKVLHDQSIPPSEMKFVRLDGTTVDVEVASVAIDLRSGREVQVIARDISARKHAEAELREKTALLEAQMDSSIDGILIVDDQHRRVLQNQRCIELWKIPREILDQDTDQQMQFVMGRTRDPQQFAQQAIYLYAHPDETSRDEIELVDGTVLDRYSAPVRGRDGKSYGRIWAFRDITARKASEVALRESEGRFKLVARAVSDVVWDWNIVTGELWWSDGFMTTFGYVASEIEPNIESWTSRIHPDERGRTVDGIYQTIDTGTESWQAEYRFCRKDGSYAFVQDRGYILRDANGKGIRMVGGMRDLTKQKEMEAQYLRAQRMESIGTLAGGIAHDLNNVLAPILMAVELLKADPLNDPKRARILDTVYISCRRGADLVRQVLSFARGLDGQRVSIRLRHLIEDLRGIIGETFPRNIRIETQVPNNLWPISGDPTQLHQVLLNLAVNARDAMPHGGTLTFAAFNLTIDAQYAGTSPEAKAGPHVLLQVTDTGVGIPPEIRERIFEPFFTTKELGTGTGLGLATVHTVVKSHGGFLQVESELGRGTTFKIYLPADPAHRVAATAHPFAPEMPRGRDELVLVVDDEFSIRHITQQTLEAFGYRVLTAGNGAEAVALYAKQITEIAVVLTDMMMPIMDGLGTIRVLRRINPAVKIIAASGLDARENVAKATGAGVHDFLAKPYTAQAMLQLVREVIDRL